MTWHGKDVNECWGLLCSNPAKVRHPAVCSCLGLIVYVPAPLSACSLILYVSVTHFSLTLKLIVLPFITPFFIYFILHISCCCIQSFSPRQPPTVITSVSSWLMNCALKRNPVLLSPWNDLTRESGLERSSKVVCCLHFKYLQDTQVYPCLQRFYRISQSVNATRLRQPLPWPLPLLFQTKMWQVVEFKSFEMWIETAAPNH